MPGPVPPPVPASSRPGAVQKHGGEALPHGAAAPGAKAPDAPDAPLPMFYAAPRPLDKACDANLRLSKPAHYRFAARTNAIPLLAEEFPQAAAHYPIVFAAGLKPIPAAVVGLKSDSNLFVDADGHWRAGTYLPAYVRRYPFILMDDEVHKQLVLCIDARSDMLGPKGEFPLFENGEPSAITKGAVEFCGTLRQQGETTDAFVHALVDQHLLKMNDAQLNMPDKTHMQLSGFLVIDHKKFDALPDAVLLEWRKKGWLDFIYAQMLSMQRWQPLADMMMKGG